MDTHIESQLKGDTANRSCRILLDVLQAKGIKNLVISPGSRNTPLIIGATARDFDIKIISDERTAAFVALGMAMGSKSPSALICTSGTALLNYAPAVAEAHYQSIPLIILSADRPMEWIDQDDSQTLIQPGALSNFVKKSFDIPVRGTNDDEFDWFVNRTSNEAINIASSGVPGPVHINIRLDNPLNKICSAPVKQNQRVVDIIDQTNLLPHIYKSLAEDLKDKKILITAGYLLPDAKLNKTLLEFEKLPQVKILAETISNLHLKGNPYQIDSILCGLSYEEECILKPDIVISIGGALVSRKLKEFLRRLRPIEHWTLNDTPLSADCFQTLSRHINVAPEYFFRGIMPYLKKNAFAPDYKSNWTSIAKITDSIRCNFLKKNSNAWCELNMYQKLLATIPNSWNVFLSNGTPVRYAQLFTDRIPHASYSNRGVSGIDGTSATAYGIASTYSGTTLLISGDISFLYDTGILGLTSLGSKFKIIVINNQGGGIFRFIQTTKKLPQREKYFCANPNLPIYALAKGYEWDYYSADSNASFASTIQKFTKSDKNCILEVIVDGEISGKILSDYLALKIN